MNELEKYFIQPGFIYTSKQPILIHTVLGSCVSVCIWDNKNIYGGINHFIYPRRGENEPTAKYGDVSTQYLLDLMIKMGSEKNDLIAHVVGGAQNPEFNSTIGMQNVDVATEILEKKGIKIVDLDTGGSLGRKITFNTLTGEILIYKCMKLREGDWYGKN